MSHAERIGLKWKNKIGNNFQKQVEIQAIKKFNEYIQAGNKVPHTYLRKLNSSWKKEIMQKKYLMKQIK